jgi:hypothetical protein
VAKTGLGYTVDTFPMRPMTRIVLSAFWLIPCTVLAAPRVLPMVVGDCDDSGLRNAFQSVVEAIDSRGTYNLLDGDGATQQLKPRPLKSEDEIKGQLASAETSFYANQFPKAGQQVNDALKDISVLPAGGKRWALFVRAQLLRSIVALGAKDNATAEQAFETVLRMDPKHQMDPDFFSPSTRSQFDKARTAVGNKKRVPFQVRSTPAGADVYLDGYNIGRTPLDTKLVPGKYLMRLGKDGLTSFDRTVTVDGLATTQVDLDFEGALRSTSPVCLAEQPGASTGARDAVRLGGLLDADQVVVVRMRKTAPDAQWLTATLLQVDGALRVREGGLKWQPNAAGNQAAELAAYITTGQPATNVVARDNEKGRAPWSTDEESGNETRLLAQSADAGVSASGPKTLRSKAWIPLAAGVALGAGAVITTIMAHGVKNEIETANPPLSPAQASALAARGRGLERTAWIMGIAGVASLGTAAAFYWFGGSSGASASIDAGHATGLAWMPSFVPVQGGGVAMISGTFGR